MSDLYSEELVEKQMTTADTLKKGGLIALLVLSILAGILMHPIILILAAVLGVVCYIFIPRFNLEYEYIYVNGELDIDKVFSKSKRKKGSAFDLGKMEIMAPADSHRLDSYKNNQAIKKVDYSSGRPEAKTYTFVYPSEKEMRLVSFEPNEAMLKDIRQKYPRKLFLD